MKKTKIFKKRLKIGLALGGGGPKGLAHIGVIKVLEENNIPIDFIAGTSIGAMIGGFYACKKDIRQVEKLAIDFDRKTAFSLLDPSFRQGFLGGRKVANFIKKHTDNLRFKDSKIPFFVVATNLKNGEAVVMSEGDISTAIRASISLPVIFRPIKRNGLLLCDGGLSLPVPVEVLKKVGADLIIAVNLNVDYFNNDDKKKSKLGIYSISEISSKILLQNLAYQNTKEADLVINPKVGNVHWKNLLDGVDVISIGENATREIIPQLKKIIKQRSDKSLLELFMIFVKRIFSR